MCTHMLAQISDARAWEKEVLSARESKRVRKHSEYFHKRCMKAHKKTPRGFNEPPGTPHLFLPGARVATQARLPLAVDFRVARVPPERLLALAAVERA